MSSDYNQYAKDCHSIEAGDLARCNKIEILDASCNYPLWTSKGIAGMYKWRALTTLFDPAAHLLDSKKSQINDLFLQLTSQSGLHMMSHAVRSMDADEEYSFLCNDCNLLIANSDVLFTGMDYERERAIGMREYLRQNATLNDEDCFYVEDNSLQIYDKHIKDTNILFPMPVILNNRLELFAKISKALCINGARSVYGLFLCYMVPNPNGQETKKYPNIPPITGLSFSELFG